MLIQLTKGVGTGPTELSAFDQALVKAGVANYNLIYLSSVLPPDSHIEVASEERPSQPTGNWGDRLYVVLAQKRTSLRNREAWAGIGWMQDEETGAGLLVEHDGNSEAEVRADIEASLDALASNRGRKFGPKEMVVCGTKCSTLPVCALVVAVFESSSWRQQTRPSNLSLAALRIRRGK